MTENAPAIRREQDVEHYRGKRADAVDIVTAAADKPMTKGERDQLLTVVRQRAKIAKEDVSARQAQLIANGEAALARKFSEQDAAWADLTADARKYMAEIKARLNDRAAELGIPTEFRPGYDLMWFSRGENATANRRAELRAVLKTQAEATAKAAKLEIDRWASDLQVAVIAGGLTGDARDLLGQLPTAEALMPPLDLPELN